MQGQTGNYFTAVRNFRQWAEAEHEAASKAQKKIKRR